MDQKGRETIEKQIRLLVETNDKLFEAVKMQPEIAEQIRRNAETISTLVLTAKM
jgi:hypothetical protein